MQWIIPWLNGRDMYTFRHTVWLYRNFHNIRISIMSNWHLAAQNHSTAKKEIDTHALMSSFVVAIPIIISVPMLSYVIAQQFEQNLLSFTAKLPIFFTRLYMLIPNYNHISVSITLDIAIDFNWTVTRYINIVYCDIEQY